MRRPLPPTASFLLALALPPTAASAQEAQPPQQQETSPGRHTLWGFVGATSGDETGFTLGARYEFRISRNIGLGSTFEHAFSGDEESVFLIPTAIIGPFGILTFDAGVGWRFVEGENDAVVRAGTRIALRLPGRWKVAPTFALDFGGGTRAIYGVLLGRQF